MLSPARRVSFAEGYFALGMHREAAAELAQVPPPLAHQREVLQLHGAVLQELRRWKALLSVAARLVQQAPQDAAGWIIWAYAARRGESLARAEEILLQGEAHHPAEATLQFNLGCYACVRGDLAEASRRVQRAVALDPAFAQAAAKDPDLKALRASRRKAKPARPKPRPGRKRS